MQGILLIGMPGAGKSTIGKKVAELLGFPFFDGDNEIEKKYSDRQKFLDDYGDEAYVDMEKNVIMGLPINNSILSPGGSIIYSKECRQYLDSCFKILLDASLDTIKKRLTNIDKRGIVYLKKMGIDALYNQRKRLYKKYTDIVVNAENRNADELAKLIVDAYSIKQLVKEKSPIKYVSTNGKSKASFTEAIMKGLAPDKGLFLPESIPSFSKEEIGLMSHLDYPSLAFVIMRQFVDMHDDKLKQICKEAYNFEIPIENNGNMFIVRLDQGPSLSFKDFASQSLAYMMEYTVNKENRKLTILTATSGDTGGAVATAFHRKKKIKVIILMPESEITKIQRKQMTTLGGNIMPVLVKGKFDDCQRLVKRAFAEIEGLSSANSINIGRLLPQTVYYFYIYCHTGADIIVVPSGNFGNLVAGLIAKRMGLPIRLVAAVNENEEFPIFLETGKYNPVVPSRKCISNAMNIGNPSNLARLVYLYGGVMDENDKLLRIPDMKKLKDDISSISITDEETRQAIKEAYKKGIVLEPHGAVGWAAIKKLKLERSAKKIALIETAHPAKFPEELDLMGISYKTPKSLAKIDKLNEKYVTINPTLEELKVIINSIQI